MLIPSQPDELFDASSHTVAQTQLNVLCNWRCSFCVFEVADGEKQRVSHESKALCLAHSLVPTITSSAHWSFQRDHK